MKPQLTSIRKVWVVGFQVFDKTFLRHTQVFSLPIMQRFSLLSYLSTFNINSEPGMVFVSFIFFYLFIYLFYDLIPEFVFHIFTVT